MLSFGVDAKIVASSDLAWEPMNVCFLKNGRYPCTKDSVAFLLLAGKNILRRLLEHWGRFPRQFSCDTPLVFITFGVFSKSVQV